MKETLWTYIPPAVGGGGVVLFWGNPPGVEWYLITFLLVARIFLAGTTGLTFFRHLYGVTGVGLVLLVALFAVI